MRVEPIAVAETVVTCGLWDEVQGLTGDPGMAAFPKTDVSWRDAIMFCNTLSLREGLTPVYTIADVRFPHGLGGVRTASLSSTTGRCRGTTVPTGIGSQRRQSGRWRAV